MKIEKSEVDLVPSELLTVNQFAIRFPAFTKASIRNMVFNDAKHNNRLGDGISESGAILRLGRRVLINPDAFFKYICDIQKHKEQRVP